MAIDPLLYIINGELFDLLTHSVYLLDLQGLNASIRTIILPYLTIFLHLFHYINLWIAELDYPAIIYIFRSKTQSEHL